MQHVEVLSWWARSGAGREQGLVLCPGLGPPDSLSCCMLLAVTCLDPQLPMWKSQWLEPYPCLSFNKHLLCALPVFHPVCNYSPVRWSLELALPCGGGS